MKITNRTEKPILLQLMDQDTKSARTKRDIISYCVEHGPVTITDLARAFMLSIPTVTKFITELEDINCLKKYGKLETAGGRHPFLYGLHPEAGYFIGVDVQQDRVNIGLIDLVGDFLASEYDLPFTLVNEESAIHELCGIIDGFIEKYQVNKADLLNVNINLPGRINPMTGESFTFFIDPEQPSLADRFAQILGTYVTIDNDTRGMAYGEYSHMIADNKGEKNVLFLNVSWGLGLGIIIDGKIYAGKSGFSGEFGHISVFDNEILCHCGKKGCLQTEISGQALHRSLIQRIQEGGASVLSKRVLDGENISLSDIIQAIKQEDILSLEVLEDIGRKLGRRVAGLINLFNPEVLIVGGSLAEAGEFLRQPIETVVRTYSLSVVSNDTKICTAALGKKSGLIGACMIARHRRFEKL